MLEPLHAKKEEPNRSGCGESDGHLMKDHSFTPFTFDSCSHNSQRVPPVDCVRQAWKLCRTGVVPNGPTKAPAAHLPPVLLHT